MRDTRNRSKILATFFRFSLLTFFSLLLASQSALAQTPFNCGVILYQVLSGELNRFDPQTGGYVAIGSTQSPVYNGIGYNVQDNFLYGLQAAPGARVVQIDATGTLRGMTLNIITGGTPTGNVGDCDTSGNCIFGQSGGSPSLSLVNNINPTALTADSNSLAVSGGAIGADAIYVPTADRYYSMVDRTTLAEIDVDEILLTATVTTKTVSGIPAGETGGFGAGFADEHGALIFFNNTTGNFYSLTGFTGMSPIGTFLVSTTPNGSNDGTACQQTDLLGDPDLDLEPNVLDLDSDNDGIPNFDEITNSKNSGDSDGDGIDDFLDLDSDNDGVPDLYEAGIPSPALLDTDNDGRIDSGFGSNGLADVVESSADSGVINYTILDTDGDLVPNYIDLDSDNDGVNDVRENGNTDSNGDAEVDGVPDPISGLTPGTNFTPADTDGDGVTDERDLDADNDGINDVIENGGTDANSDALADGTDVDGDGIQSSADGMPASWGDLTDGAPLDGDSDGVSNFRDLDADNDTISDVTEGGNVTADTDSNGTILPADTNSSDSDGDGIPNSVDASGIFGDAGSTATPDSDTDGTRDFLDLDSNDDGIFDIDTAPFDFLDGDNDGRVDTPTDPDGDGIANNSLLDSQPGGFAGLSSTAPLDSDGDGIRDYIDIDIDNDGVLNTVEIASALNGGDTDGDGISDEFDLDSDNDGIPDITEAGGTDTNGDGAVDSVTDTDGDGWANVFDPSNGGTPLTDPDNDADSIANRVDLDSDGDGLTDILEAGGTDANSDGVLDPTFSDPDGDGLSDLVDTSEGGTALILPNTDGTGSADYIDTDSDNDGNPDVIEAGGVDANGDGIADTLTDTDGDGWVNLFDSDNGGTPLVDPDTDTDGILNRHDLDSDDDGLTDILEAGGTDTNGDGVIDGVFSDPDGDGLSDIVDTSEGGTALTLPNTDGTGSADYIDTDSDDDTISDNIEAQVHGMGFIASTGTDTDGDGIDDAYDLTGGSPIITPVNTDGSGLADYRDLEADGDGLDDSVEGTADTDGDSTPNYRDLDSDNDGVPDTSENNGDTDGDGTDDYLDLDSDNDGILDSAEGAMDSDNDTILNFLDLDSDNDGIPDIIEGGGVDTNGDGVADSITDTDGDGWANLFDPDNGGSPLAVPNNDGDGQNDFLDVDSDGDGLTDLFEANGTDSDGNGRIDGLFSDADGDGFSASFDTSEGGTALLRPNTDGLGERNYLDTDSDEDAIPDNIEGQSSPPGYISPSGTDTDGDGLDDAYDVDDGGLPIASPVNTDGVTPPDYRDTDSDNDGISDATEGTGDNDSDFAPNYRDLDSDGDGLPDAIEGTIDTDGDMVPDYLDTDSDDDGTPDFDEGFGDSDGDGVSDYLDPDTDNDGILDIVEGNTDTDGDGLANRLDRDSDNDGIPDVIEAGGSDANGDGLPDSFTDADLDGVLALFDVTEGGSPLADGDFDIDSIVNRLDLDSDGDGIVDLIEGGGVDANSNGTVDGIFIDPDGDGFAGIYDRNDGGTPLPLPNSDANAGRDYLDLDSDNDAIPDNVEGQPSPPGHIPPSGTDTDGDGIDDAYDIDIGGLPIVPVNTDAVGAADYRDVDADNDGILDAVEGTMDSDLDLAPNYRDLDSDADGIPDAIEGTVDSDGDTTPNYLDTDSDDDSLPDSGEGSLDSDGDGVADFRDIDSDNDGILDEDELGDTDTDGAADYLDHDSDNDGIPDLVEAGGTDANGDGEVDSTADTNGNGWANIFDPANGGTLLTDTDLDGDGLKNRTDVDSDADGITDLFEAGGTDSDKDGQVDGIFDDSDGDGLFSAYDTDDGGTPLTRTNTDSSDGEDYLDADADGDSIADNVEAQPHGAGFRAPLLADTDGDGLDNEYDADDSGTSITLVNTDSIGSPDFRDSDSDNDGIVDSIELTGDPDGDGIPNYRDLDSDGDGLLDSTEGAIDTDGDTTPDYLDTNSDNDGIPDSVEGSSDTDGDGRPDYRDIDSDNDGILDADETSADTDGDGVLNFRDHDSDNDGLADIVEAGGVDANGDGKVDSASDTDGDGWVNLFDPTNGGTPLPDDDLDGDSLRNRLDLDSDGDGITDLREANGSDADGNGQVDGTFNDTDGDGFSNLYDTDNSGTALNPPNTDSTGGADYLDSDSDDDSISDNIEAQVHGMGYLAPTGSDTDGDGIDNAYDPSQAGTALTNLVDTDTSSVPDFRDTESDGDGISDMIEGTGDPDSDGTPNYRDLDSDGDLINDSVEGSGDSDGDTTPDFLDSDSDNDGVPDSAEGTTDTDGDGVENYRDIDSDSDGILDSVETNVDLDRDGIPNRLDLDSDNDGITDLVEAGGTDTNGDGQADVLTDTDADGLADTFDSDNGGTALPLPNADSDMLPNFLDIDSDADGIPDIREAQTGAGYVTSLGSDTDADGLDNAFDVDNGGTAIVPQNTDGTTSADPYDTDADDDGVIDAIEGHDNNADGIADVVPVSADTDGDGLDNAYDTVALVGIAQTWTNAAGSNAALQDRDTDGQHDWRDTDDDADTIPTSLEDANTDNNWANDDSDSDSTPDYLDLDSDNDGILNVTECLGQVSCPDTDGDGVANHLDADSDNDGIPDITEGSMDKDGDLTRNFLDLDSDNDGVADIIEAGGLDSNGNGRVDSLTDADGDGLLNLVDADEGGTALSVPNSDSDSAANYLDIDSDSDGIVDIIEAQTTSGYLAPIGTDTDGDGLDNRYDSDNGGTALSPINTGGGSAADYLDTDSDGDGITDAIEGHDANFNGIADVLPSGSDSDSDGLDDAFDTFDLNTPPVSGNNAEGSNAPLPNRDADSLPDWRDNDDDGDGIPTLSEMSVDTDGDGIPDYLDLDSDGDGAFDADENGSDTDGDGTPDYLDPNCTVNIIVQLPSGEAIEGATVTDATRTDISDNTGAATLLNVPNGTYTLTTTLQGGGLIGQSQFTVASGICPNLVTVVARRFIQNPLYFVWNGFYNQNNVAGTINRCNFPIGVQVSLIDSSGLERSAQSVPIAAHGEFDVIANALQGFSTDSYGYIKVNYSNPECAEGYGAHYRFSNNLLMEEFSIAKPFESLQVGTTWAEFNTLQPALDPGKLDDETPHWIQIVNLNPNQLKRFRVLLRDLGGNIVDDDSYDLPPLARLDTQGGHETPGRLSAGTIQIIPLDSASPYLAQVHMYNADGPIATLADTFSFADGVTTGSGTGNTQYVHVSNGAGGMDWLVVSNSSESEAIVDLEIRSNDGTVRQTRELRLPPFAQEHIFASGILVGSESGIAKLKERTGRRIFARNMVYFPNRQGGIAAAYGMPSRSVFGGTLTAGYNTFFGSSNFLKLSNVTTSSVDVTITAYDINGNNLGSTTRTLAALSGRDFDIASFGFAFAPDSYGMITVEPTIDGAVYGELLRIDYVFGSTEVDMAKALPVR